MAFGGVLSNIAKEQAAAPVEINPAYKEALSAYEPEDQSALSQSLDAVAKSLNLPALSPEQIGAVVSNSADFLKDVRSGEPVQTRIQRGLSNLSNAAKIASKEAEQEQFASEIQQNIRDAIASGKELTAKQQAVFDEQLASIKKQAGEATVVSNELYRQAGLKPVYDESGNLTGLDQMDEAELLSGMTSLQQQQYNIAKQTSQKQLDALAGKIDMDPGLINSLDEQEKELRSVLEQKLGANYERSTPGIQALTKFNDSRTRIEESARLAWIQTGQGLVTSALGTQQAAQASQTGATVTPLASRQQLTVPTAQGATVDVAGRGTQNILTSALNPSISGSAAVFGGFQNVLAPRYAQQDFQRQGALIQSESEAADTGSPWTGVLAGLLGAGIGSVGGPVGAAAGKSIASSLFGT